ncbi:unnamed protein product [Prorocentrum cordatum]|nr:unnamed protein product [Polarella glacialis]
MGSTLVTPGAREAGRADLPGFPPWAPSPAAAPADSWWHHRLCSAPEPAPEELVGGGVEPRVPQPGPALSEPASPPPKVTPSTPAGSRLTPPQRAQSRRSPSVMVKRSTTQTTVSRMRSSTHEPSTSSSRSSPNASCSSRLARMARRVEAAAVEKFLQEHRFSGIDHCRRAGRWPLSRRCCPLSLAAQRGDVSTVILLLKQGADPLLPLTLLRRQQATGAWQQDARRLLERAAGETGRGLAAESGALWSIFHVVDPWAESGRSRCSASWSAAIPCCAGLGRGRPDRRRAGGGRNTGLGPGGRGGLGKDGLRNLRHAAGFGLTEGPFSSTHGRLRRREAPGKSAIRELLPRPPPCAIPPLVARSERCHVKSGPSLQKGDIQEVVEHT